MKQQKFNRTERDVLFQQKYLRNCIHFVQYSPRLVPNIAMSVPARAHAQLSNKNCITYHMEEISSSLLHIYRNCWLLQIEPSGWKGSVYYGLGADISLPHCLATGIWTLVPKATSGPKSRGASFGTTLWRHVQRYCAHSLAFMQIHGYLFTHAQRILEIINFVPYLSFLIIISKFKSKSATACNCLRLRLLLLWLNVFYVAVKNLSFFFAQTVPKSYFYRRFKMDDHQFLIWISHDISFLN